MQWDQSAPALSGFQPLPSLLAAPVYQHSDTSSDWPLGGLASPKRVHIGGHIMASLERSPEETTHAPFDASSDLQRSLEQLLRSQLGGDAEKLDGEKAPRARSSTATSTASEVMVSTTKTEV